MASQAGVGSNRLRLQYIAILDCNRDWIGDAIQSRDWIAHPIQSLDWIVIRWQSVSEIAIFLAIDWDENVKLQSIAIHYKKL